MRFPTVLGFIALAAALQAPPAGAALKVVTSTTDLASITSFVGGDLVEATALARGNQDPHFVEARPSYMMQCRDADLFIRVGMSLEVGYEQPIVDGSRNSRIRPGSPGHLDVSANIRKLEVPSMKVTRAQGDVHPEGNPHYWLDPYNARIIARDVGEKLAELDPAHAEQYRRRAAEFEAEVDRRMFGADVLLKIAPSEAWAMQNAGTLKQALADRGLEAGGWVGRLLPYRGEHIVTYHTSWTYFAHAFGLVILDRLEPKPGIPPSPGHVAKVIETMRKDRTRVILMEPYYDRKPADRVARDTSARVVMVANSVGGSETAPDYFGLIDQIVSGVAAAFGS